MQNARRLLHLAEWMRRTHRYEDALRYLEQASTAFVALFPDQHSSRGALARARGLVYRDQNRLDEAEREFRFAAENFTRTGSKDANPTIEVELQLADVQLARGHVDEARALHERVAPLLDERFVAQSPVRAQYAALGKRLAGVKPVAVR